MNRLIRTVDLVIGWQPSVPRHGIFLFAAPRLVWFGPWWMVTLFALIINHVRFGDILSRLSSWHFQKCNSGLWAIVRIFESWQWQRSIVTGAGKQWSCECYHHSEFVISFFLQVGIYRSLDLSRIEKLSKTIDSKLFLSPHWCRRRCQYNGPSVCVRTLVAQGKESQNCIFS